MNNKLNGKLKYAAIPTSMIAVLGLMFGMVRYSQGQMNDFCNKYEKRVRKVEEASFRTDEKLKSIKETTDRIWAKLDNEGRK